MIRFFRKHFRNGTICIWFLFSSLPSLNHTKLHFIIQTHLISTFFLIHYDVSALSVICTQILTMGKWSIFFKNVIVYYIQDFVIIFMSSYDLSLDFRLNFHKILISSNFNTNSMKTLFTCFFAHFFLIQFDDGVYSALFIVVSTFSCIQSKLFCQTLK